MYLDEQTLPRRERERLRQRSEMLTAALALFSERGYHNVSMQEIAVTAEFAVGTLYKFFTNKEELYKALISEQADRFHTALNAALSAEGDARDRLRNYVETKGRIYQDNAACIRLYFAEHRGASFNIKAGLDSDIRARCELVLRRLEGVFADGMTAGIFRQTAVPYHLALALDSLCNAFLFHWLEDQQPYPESPDTILNILFIGLLATPS